MNCDWNVPGDRARLRAACRGALGEFSVPDGHGGRVTSRALTSLVLCSDLVFGNRFCPHLDLFGRRSPCSKHPTSFALSLLIRCALFVYHHLLSVGPFGLGSGFCVQVRGSTRGLSRPLPAARTCARRRRRRRRPHLSRPPRVRGKRRQVLAG